MQTKFEISGFNLDKYEITPHLTLVDVTDFMGEKMHNLSISFTHIEDGAEMPFANFTLNFGEFIGMKNSAYIDTNNCWFADEILQTGVAQDTGLTKISGFCKYPLWVFKEEFLEAVDKGVYQQYLNEFDGYMKARMPSEKPDEEPTMEM